MKQQVDRYLDFKRHAFGTQTYKNVESALNRFATEWDKTRRVTTSLTEEWLSDYLLDIRAGRIGEQCRPLAASSYNKRVEQLQGFLNWAVRRGVVTPLVLDALQRCADREPREFLQLSSAQVVHMIETTENPWERWVLALGSQTLGRDSELRNRQVKHMHLDRGVLDWYRKKTVDLDQLPITQPLADEWQRWAYHYQSYCGSLQPEWPLIPRRHSGGGTGVSHYYLTSGPPMRGLAQIVQKHASRVSGLPQESLKGQGVHILRRSMARALYERLAQEQHAEPLRVVQALLGHADSKTTRVYIGVRPDREERNKLLVGSDLLWVEQSNVIELRSVDHG
jgi:integrase